MRFCVYVYDGTEYHTFYSIVLYDALYTLHSTDYRPLILTTLDGMRMVLITHLSALLST